MEGSFWCQTDGAIGMPTAQLGFEHWALDGPSSPKTVGFCDLLGTPYAPVSKIPPVKIHETISWADQNKQSKIVKLLISQKFQKLTSKDTEKLPTLKLQD